MERARRDGYKYGVKLGEQLPQWLPWRLLQHQMAAVRALAAFLWPARLACC
jgi:hypothetical protein